MREFPVRLLGETEKNWKFDIGLKDGVWLPKDQVQFNPMEGTVLVPPYLVEQHGLEDLK